MSSTGRFMCYFLYSTLLINLISDTNGQMPDRVGPKGLPGIPGAKGEKGQKGEKGEVGPFGKTEHETSHDEIVYKRPEPPKHGSEADPATSCQDEKLNTSMTGLSVVIYPAKPFQVTCISSDTEVEDVKTCLLKSETKEFKGERYKFQRNPFWLSTKGFDLLRFYDVSLEIIVHCKNTEISHDPEKYLQLHLWDGQNIGPFPNSQSLVSYDIPDEFNKCKDFTDETKWETATIKLSGPSTFIKDFYIRDIKEDKEQGISLELKEFCIYN